VTLDARGRIAHRKVLGSRPVTWVGSGSGLILAQDGSGLVVLDTRLAEIWRDVSNDGPASADKAAVYTVGARGLAAIAR
jgi:hypothetical protein